MDFHSRVWLSTELSPDTKLAFHGNMNSSFVAYHLRSFLNEQPHLLPFIICPDNEMTSVESDIKAFFPEKTVLKFTSFDVSPYSGLLPNRNNPAKRIRFLSRLLKPQGNEIFLAKACDTLLRLISPQKLKEGFFDLSAGFELDSNFYEKLSLLQYSQVDITEEPGQFSIKGGMVDLFSPYHDLPVRLELFGEQIESLRFFDPKSQLSLEACSKYSVVPMSELNFYFFKPQQLSQILVEDLKKREVDKDLAQGMLSQISRKIAFPELDFLFPLSGLASSKLFDFLGPQHFSFSYNNISIINQADTFLEEEKKRSVAAKEEVICPPLDKVYFGVDEFKLDVDKLNIHYKSLLMEGEGGENRKTFPTRMQSVDNLKKLYLKFQESGEDLFFKKIQEQLEDKCQIFLTTNTKTKAKRLASLFESHNIESHLLENYNEKIEEKKIIILPHATSNSFFYELENTMFLSEVFFYGKKSRKSPKDEKEGLSEKISNLNFSDLKVGDKVVHISHGIGQFDGMKEISIGGVKSELIQLSYKEQDKLYLPIYRIHQIQKFRGHADLDKLGSNKWEKTKIKVKASLRDIASDLLQLYAKRKQLKKTPFDSPDNTYYQFEDQFPYEETEDQLKAIEAILNDMTSDKPMDRLICGDVGFGKTEIALRASFKAFQDYRQVAVLVPTTVLAFQHYETFTKRFKGFDCNIKMLSRFSSRKEISETLSGLKEGKVNIVIGTHRILSSDISFQNLGLLIIDEEHRFGVKHKERIRKLKLGIDTLAMSATPIPRTLNMSLMGIRDLSLINTAPQDRLPIRTYVLKHNYETLRQAIENEVKRGGQVFFLHNRVQSIYQKEQELKEILPNIRIRTGHGQLEENQLEKIMISFYKGEFDVLLCTTIIESGIDNPKANTMIIDNAQNFGVSQLYQIRGRVGRSKERAYCYLVIPPNMKLDKTAQERLRVIQENTELGSGFRVASHDLDLRGAGSILGENQSGHVNAVGYDLYMELLDEALREAKGEEPLKEDIEPDISIPIPALIPDEYIADIRTRLAYYKAMSEADTTDDMAKIEEELRDQFGKLPDEVLNLMGIMLIRSICKKLGIKDIRSTKTSTALAFSQQTTVRIEELVKLAQKQAKKYKLTPDGRLLIYMDSMEWEKILSEMEDLKSLLL